ncbi:MAG: oligopeptide transporter, OPT family [Deltaproteobacteria bacterium RIFCSPLOWO2_12_FULL_44_12]|nr:MAG: oligopeptide transporter, OPT family [Deltaproteobacteria bacterium RIFCSPHIGHO2_01_FULL_43_49]OGQ15731.1 MAG: oligopeptide transporter, OPT family [Deltaproteobacteria bacterium RIFCSPHIGHO2_02_FULL_44_53]OGQ28700.1 MAG: oligopeptide transporter, OPT family [Deltaproteobacteria bacterium RIFCSPHIGHO2_12_FULL_44_21]OGQ32023.1 MAG: oligopeptide transporter, OPT family [Deltaproteobacteria bacterium RIFCSPLOWO2_01_FULL_45_74]OGQ43636.1 MAG: oligopeptide transporter, OPT family [Deltaprote
MARRPTEFVVEPLEPYIPSQNASVPEFTLRSIILGLILGLLFNAANAYLGLKIGLTVSASIPSAVISMFVLRMLLPKIWRKAKPGTILENNIVHCFASAGEAMAAAIIFTIPAILFLGNQFSNSQIFLLGTAGGVLGLMMMIPLRHALVVKEHENLPFPEGTACSKVLVAGDKGGVTAKPVFKGMGIGALFKFAMSAFYLWKDQMFWSFKNFYKAGFGFEISPLLVGVGFLVGPRVAATLLGGGLLGFMVIIPAVAYLGGSNIVFPGTSPISDMSTMAIRANYLKYIGAGTVAFGGLLSIVKSLPDIIASLRYSVRLLFTKSDATVDAKQQRKQSGKDPEIKNIAVGGAILGFLVGAFGGDQEWNQLNTILMHVFIWGGLGTAAGWLVFYGVAKACAIFSYKFIRIERDMPLPMVLGLMVLMFLVIWLVPAFDLSFVETLLVIVFCFFFVAVSSRMVGLIGNTNQPVSGMTITALLFITVIFVALGHDASTVKMAAIMGGAAVCIAICMSGDLSQDLKTAAMVGATPWKVEVAQIAAVLLSAVRSGFILLLLYWAYGFGDPTAAHPNPLEAPQAQLMAKLVEGATGGNLPWTLLIFGAVIGLVFELCSVSALQIGIGLYLPITTWPMIMVGGLLSVFTQKRAKSKEEAFEIHHQGSLYASGLIAGDALTGILIAVLTVGGLDKILKLRDPSAGFGTGIEDLLATALYAAVVFLFYRACMKGRKANA